MLALCFCCCVWIFFFKSCSLLIYTRTKLHQIHTHKMIQNWLALLKIVFNFFFSLVFDLFVFFWVYMHIELLPLFKLTNQFFFHFLSGRVLFFVVIVDRKCSFFKKQQQNLLQSLLVSLMIVKEMADWFDERLSLSCLYNF